MAQKGVVEHRLKENVGRQRALPSRTSHMNTKPCTEKTFSAVGCERMWMVKKRKGRG